MVTTIHNLLINAWIIYLCWCLSKKVRKMLRNILIMSRFKLKDLKFRGRNLNLSNCRIIMAFLLELLMSEEAIIKIIIIAFFKKIISIKFNFYFFLLLFL